MNLRLETWLWYQMIRTSPICWRNPLSIKGHQDRFYFRFGWKSPRPVAYIEARTLVYRRRHNQGWKAWLISRFWTWRKNSVKFGQFIKEPKGETLSFKPNCSILHLTLKMPIYRPNYNQKLPKNSSKKISGKLPNL